MGAFSISDILKRNSELSWVYDFEFKDEKTHRAYLKKMALETCINFIGRSISQTDFRISKDNKRVYNHWHYLLNVRPNTDQSASEFWQSFIYKLLFDNEVLVIKTDTNDLLIADDFRRIEYAVYEDVFTSVVVKNYMFNRTYRMSEVIYITYNNENLSVFMDGMFTDYGELFGRIIEANKMKNQIRSVAKMESTQALTTENMTKLQKFIDKMFNAIRNNTVAIVPKIKGFDYEEISNGSSNGQSVDEITKFKKSVIDDVAKILGIPTALVHGEMADLEKSMKAYIKFCNNPLLKKIVDELNNKIFEKEEYLKGWRVTGIGISNKSAIENAESVDKLVASGSYTRNEVRMKMGDEPADDPELDKFVITKNYQSAQAVEGGEE